MAKIKWTLECGAMTKSMTADDTQHPVEVATQIIEKYFHKMFKKNTKTVSMSVITMVSNGLHTYVLPSDLIFANAGLYNHAEILQKLRIKLSQEYK